VRRELKVGEVFPEIFVRSSRSRAWMPRSPVDLWAIVASHLGSVRSTVTAVAWKGAIWPGRRDTHRVMRDICCRSPDGVGGQLDLFRVAVSFRGSNSSVVKRAAAATRGHAIYRLRRGGSAKSGEGNGGCSCFNALEGPCKYSALENKAANVGMPSRRKNDSGQTRRDGRDQPGA
jgi:hypothetical protein